MSFSYDQKRNLCAYAVDVARGGKNLKKFLASLPSAEDLANWSPDQFQSAFVRLCGAANLHEAHAEANRDELDGNPGQMTAAERHEKQKKLQRQQYFLGKGLFGAFEEKEPDWFRALFQEEFAQRFPYLWRRDALSAIEPGSSIYRKGWLSASVDLMVGEGAEDIVRAAATSWGDTGQLIDFREADAWERLEKFGQIEFGMLAASVSIVGVREVLAKGAADSFISRLASFAQSHPRIYLQLAVHRKDHHFFIQAKSDIQHFDMVTVHDLDRLIDELQWWKTYKLSDKSGW